MAQGADRRRARRSGAGAGAKVGVDVVDVDSGKTALRAQRRRPVQPGLERQAVHHRGGAGACSAPSIAGRRSSTPRRRSSGGELKGRLYLKGHGDPSLVVEDLWRVVSDLYAGGLRKVSGDLVVDDTFFDDVRVGPGFEQKQEDSAVPRAQRRALAQLQRRRRARAARAPATRAPARVVIDPQTPYFTVVNEARTVAAGRTALTVESREAADHTEIDVRGRIRVGDAGQVAAAARGPSRPLHGQRLPRAVRRGAASRSTGNDRARRDADDGAGARRRTTRSRSAWSCATSTSAPTTSWPSRS